MVLSRFIDRCLLGLVVVAVVLGAAIASAEEGGGGSDEGRLRRCKGAEVNLNFVEADLATVIAAVSKITGRRFIVTGSPPPVKITVFSPRPVCPDDAFQAFLSALAANGLTVVRRGRFYVVMSADDAVRGPVPVVVER